MTGFTHDHMAEVHDLATRTCAFVRQASSPEVALNALLAAYINTAADAGVLQSVPGAGLALGAAAEQLLALRGGEPCVHH